MYAGLHSAAMPFSCIAYGNLAKRIRLASGTLRPGLDGTHEAKNEESSASVAERLPLACPSYCLKSSRTVRPTGVSLNTLVPRLHPEAAWCLRLIRATP